ncbi:DNA topoisomerase III [Shewanella cyperi]|uniref:DNA topoisomerase 3 n=1 Tax=Shewanella cyperi TaxID=2814292 RepID=A0A975AJK8_9GAMM|nr:DNA topoisomerase III [Shewanella cyperi]QSX28816.1 DNA topoisomerase III [Shewanella cyperi]
MILYIAEKPSLGRAIADVLPKPHTKGDGYIQLGNGDCVTWCIGHLLEQAEPDAYDPAFKSWQFEHLPIVPERWQLVPKASAKGQLAVVKRLLKQASTIVHAGDPDREGQLLVDEVLSFAGVDAARLANTRRLLISDLNPEAVKRALAQQRSNKEFVPLATSALARSRADWLYGMNMTRAYTLAGRKVGYQGVLSVGRVQTPLLGLVVRRDAEIANFQPRDYYEVMAHIITTRGERFCAKWQPSDACQPYMDEEGRVLSQRLAQKVVDSIANQPAQLLTLETKPKRQAPPLPYSLSALQIDCGKRFGMSAKEVLDTAQALYEKHKLITYPRSDSRHLPKAQLAQVPTTLAAIAQGAAELTAGLDAPDPKRVSKAWDDSKVDAHHAIVPTEKVANLGSLALRERQLYLQIARQYLAQFYPHHEYDETEVLLQIAGGRFGCKAKRITRPGWKPLFGQQLEEDEGQSNLPALNANEPLHCERGELLSKQTQPPKHFTDATLLAAMTGIARYVQSADIKKILKETDGLGTEATRAGIIELLFKRGFLVRQGKQILATDAGKGLIASLPEVATTADMTALWESRLNGISHRELAYQAFMAPLTEQLQGLIAEAAASVPTALAGVSAKPAWKKGRAGRKGYSSKGNSSKSYSGKGTTAKGNSAKSKTGAAAGSSTRRSAVKGTGAGKSRSSAIA